MRVKHREFSIYIRAPWDHGRCTYGPTLSCKNDGDFAVSILDDRDQILRQYGNICSSHLLMFVIDQILGY